MLDGHIKEIISEILYNLNESDFNYFINSIKKDYKNIYFIQRILNGVEHNNSWKLNNDNNRYNRMNELFEKMKVIIIKEKINLYSKENFNKYNIWIIQEDLDYMRFIKKNINVENLMLLVVDGIGFSEGENTGYNFNKEFIDSNYGWDKLKKNIYECENCELKDFLIEALSNIDKSEVNEGRYVYYTNKRIDIDDLINKYLNR